MDWAHSSKSSNSTCSPCYRCRRTQLRPQRRTCAVCRKKEVQSGVAEPRKQLKRVKQPEATEEAPATHAKKGFGKGQQAATVSTKGKAKPQGLNGTKQANVTGVGVKTAAVAKAGRHQKKQIV